MFTFGRNYEANGFFGDPMQMGANAIQVPDRVEGEKQDKQVIKGFVPVTIAMIDSADVQQDDKCLIDREYISEVQVVGRIIALVEEQNRIVFEISDSTGSMPVIFYRISELQQPAAL